MSADISMELRERAAWRAKNEGPFTKENLVEWRAADRIAILEAERDDARRQRDEIGRAWDEADARAKEAEARAASLEKALAPFAEALPLLFNDWCPDDTPAWWIDGEQPGDENRSPVTVGDFRRAASLSSSKQKDGE